MQTSIKQTFLNTKLHITHQQATQSPTIVLSGWTGASHKNLHKYTQIFHKMHYNTVEYILPLPFLFSPNVQYLSKQLFAAILDTLESDKRLTEGGLIFIHFSNAGAISAPHLSDILAADDYPRVQKAVAGVVFDSAPCYIHPEVVSGAFCEGLRVPVFIRPVFYALFWMFMWVLSFRVDVRTEFWNLFRDARFGVPELYLFSEKDLLLDCGKLAELLDERRRLQCDVRVFRVKDAEHVLLLRKYPDAYVRAVRVVNEWVNVHRERLGIRKWVLDKGVEDEVASGSGLVEAGSASA